MATQTTTITAAESMLRKAALESKLRQLLSVFGAREELRIEYLADPIDRVRSSTDREMTIQRLDHETRLIHDVQFALAKIEQGTYGVCERCESSIARKRLDAIPWARLCVRCQADAEAAEHGGKPSLEDAA